MIKKPFLSFLLVVVHIFLLSSESLAQQNPYEQHLEVALRMVGHKILHNSGDTSSRVLPIQKLEDRYLIRFDTPFQFEPNQLVSTIRNVVEEAEIVERYIVEVKKCDSEEIVYSYEIGDSMYLDIIPCSGRPLPIACYNLFFTFFKKGDSEAFGMPITFEGQPIEVLGIKPLSFLLLAFPLVLLGVILYILGKKKQKKSEDPNLIHIGEYQFDKKNTELLFEHQRIELTNKEADLLLFLYDTANKTVERNEILRMVWGDEGDYIGRTLDVFISKLRKKLEADSNIKIVNIRGVGYKLVVNA